MCYNIISKYVYDVIGFSVKPICIPTVSLKFELAVQFIIVSTSDEANSNRI